MGVAPSASTLTKYYSSLDECSDYLPAGSGTVANTPVKGQVSTAFFNKLLAKWSRDFDSKFGCKGFELPFPDLATAVAATSVRPPQKAVDIVTARIVADVRQALNYGNRRARDVSDYRNQAVDLETALLKDPRSIGDAEVLTPEILTNNIKVAQFGRTIQPLYRLANRNINPDSLYFCDSTGAEVMRPEGYPFSLDLADYDVLSAAEGLVYLLNEAQILAAVGASGGLKYQFSWRKLDWGQAHPTRFPGVHTR